MALPAAVANLPVLSAGAIEPGLKAAAAFDAQTGHANRITFNTASQLRKRMHRNPAFDAIVLACAERGDSEGQADKLLAKILKLRIFSDDAGKMNRSVQDIDGQGACGGLLIVSQFTLAADVSGRNRPSFTSAAPPDAGQKLYNHLVARARSAHPKVETGRFGADIQVHQGNCI